VLELARMLVLALVLVLVLILLPLVPAFVGVHGGRFLVGRATRKPRACLVREESLLYCETTG
jgi:hypothetical protein